MKIEIKNKYAFFTVAIVVLLAGIGIAVGVYDSTKGAHDTLWTDIIEPKKGDSIVINGNVGIGTTNPSQKLDVIGDIKTSGIYRVGTAAGVTTVLNFPTPGCDQSAVTQMVFTGGIMTSYTVEEGPGCPGE